jgi:quercetin dioxygenase-like cupin family protein
MRIYRVLIGICGLLLCGCAGAPAPPSPHGSNETPAMPLILEKNEGERRIVRGWPGHPDPGETFILKVDPKNGASSHLVFMTADLKPGGEIPSHKHPGADEILYLENGTARVHLGDTIRAVHGGATVFIPANTWISVENIGDETISAVGVFSAPGFEEFMRESSVLEGEKNVPMTPDEDEASQKKHTHDVIYR